MKFKYLDTDAMTSWPVSDQDGQATVDLLIDIRDLLRQQLNELRCIRSLHYSLPDPEDLKAQEGKG